MGTTRKVFRGVAGCLSGTVIGGTVVGGINATLGALSGLVGAKVLESAGHVGYVASEAIAATATGSVILTAPIGALTGGCLGTALAFGFFTSNNSDKKKSSNSCAQVVGTAAIYAGAQALSAVIGRDVLINNEMDFTMSTAKVAASAAVGGAITSIPVSITLICCAGAIAIGIYYCATAISNLTDDKESHNDEESMVPSVPTPR